MITCPSCGNKFNLPEADGFDQFWNLYPRKIGKGQARKAYKLAHAKVGKEVLLSGVKAFRELARSKEKEFVCHASTWLTGERWTDEELTTSVSPSLASSAGVIPPQQVNSSWPPEAVSALSALIGTAKFASWFSSAEFVPSAAQGEPTVIRVKTALYRDVITTRFAMELFRAVGAFEVVAEPPIPKPRL